MAEGASEGQAATESDGALAGPAFTAMELMLMICSSIMSDEDRGMTYDEMLVNTATNLSRALGASFDSIAKIAIRASAEFSEDEDDTDIVAKIQKAHSTVTLIMDDAMRGLNKATLSALAFTVVSTLQGNDEENLSN